MSKEYRSILEREVRSEFPFLLPREVGEKPIVYLDNAATTQKPFSVLRAMEEAYVLRCANVHRGVHRLSQEATEAHEGARRFVASYIGARESAEVLFTRGTTESINLISSTFCPRFMKAGDEIFISAMEHHSNIVPWQMQAEALGLHLRVIPITSEGEVDLVAYRSMLNHRVKLVSVCHASNVLGTINPVAEMAREAHDVGAVFVVDGAQSIAHETIDVNELGVDFYAMSAHKVYGPTGLGILYGRREWLDQMPPYQGGGEMIERVTFEGTTYNVLPYKYEAGTPDFVGSVGLRAALEYVEGVGLDRIVAHEQALLSHATEELLSLPYGAKVYGTSPHKAGVLSFSIDGVHPYDLGVLLDQMGIAIRTGHHCAQPLMAHLGLEGVARVSFALYNTHEEVEAFIAAMRRVVPILL